MQALSPSSRRVLLQALVSTALPIRDHGEIKPPLPAPDVAVVRQDGSLTRLSQLLEGRATALQVMFTGCATTCPIQGAIFERVQKLIPNMAARHLQLVSLSIDPAHDTPQAMCAWLRRFHAGPAWIGVAPATEGLARVKDFFGRGRDATDDHSTQTHLLNRQGQLVWRTFELSSAEEIAGILLKL